MTAATPTDVMLIRWSARRCGRDEAAGLLLELLELARLAGPERVRALVLELVGEIEAAKR